jgi:hypothetical protein
VAPCSHLGPFAATALSRGDSQALSAVSAESPRFLQLRLPGSVRRASSAHSQAMGVMGAAYGSAPLEPGGGCVWWRCRIAMHVCMQSWRSCIVSVP